jgi:antimicrobial peptide system SdpA family protein
MKSIYSIVVWSVWMFIIINLFFSYIPSVFPVNDKTKEILTLLFPQGWGFFTKNPKEDNTINVYTLYKDELKLVSIPNASFHNGFGISRKSRYIRYETAVLLTKSDSSIKWAKCIGMPKINKLAQAQSINLKSNISYRYFEKGKEYIIIQHKIVPWAWAKYNQEQNNEYAYTKIKLI